jgi:hypothetical protein
MHDVFPLSDIKGYPELIAALAVPLDNPALGFGYPNGVLPLPRYKDSALCFVINSHPTADALTRIK